VAGLANVVNQTMFTNYNADERNTVLQAAIRGDRVPADAGQIISGVNSAMFVNYDEVDRTNVIAASVAGPYAPDQIVHTVTSINQSMFQDPEAARVQAMIGALGPRWCPPGVTSVAERPDRL
jgi:hypothetical protein